MSSAQPQEPTENQTGKRIKTRTRTRQRGLPQRAKTVGDSPTSFAWPAVIYLAIVVGGPLVLVMIYSFLTRGKFGVGVVWEPTAKAWKQLVAEEQLDGSFRFNSQYLSIIGKSFVLAGVATVFTVICGVPLAVWMSFRSARWRQILVFAVTIPFWTNTLVRTYAWMLILNDNGLINRALQRMGVIEAPLRLLYNSSATLVGLVYTFLPFMVLPVYASAEKFDFRLAEAAFDLGARRSQMLRRIVLPLIKPGVIAGIVLVFIPALGSFLQPELLGGGKSLMIGNLIQTQFGASRNWPFGSALAAALMIIVLLVLMFFSWSSRRAAKHGAAQVSLL